MKKLDKSKVIYNFSPDNEEVLKINSGDEVSIESYDCFKNELKSEEDSLAEFNWDHINPATGPIYVNGAEVGDTLKVKIKDIKIEDQSVMIVAPEEGLMGERIEKSQTKIIKIEDGMAIFSDKIKIPIKPMIGVIGTAPIEDEIPAGTPGDHGANMDCKTMIAGNTLYLPVNVEGGLFALGDLHSVMGDGEVAVSGAETAGVVELKIELLKNKKMPLPFLESEDKITTIASANTLDEAVKISTNNMVDYLVDNYNFDFNEATMLLSLVGDAKICQVVDPKKTARFEVEKKYLKS
ncbi:MAG: acetamidase/formamidase family protein [Halanaerobiales bacterium]